MSQPARPFDFPFLYWGPKFGVIDWSGQGSEDLMVRSEGYAFFLRRTFLTHGYRLARLVAEPR
ncbi:MAG: hypothetical protein ACKV0T_04370 [Planctomycetales bacterium]